MAAINDADGHVVGVTPEGRLLVSIDGSVAQANVGVKDALDARINPATEEKLEAVRALLDTEDFASQTTLEAIRALLAAEDFSTEVTLAALLTAYLDRVPKTTKQYADGLFRNAGGIQGVASGGLGILQVANPVGSGINLTITQFSLAATIEATVEFWVDRTLTAPTSETPWMPNRLYEGVATTKGLVKRATAATGGTKLSPSVRLSVDVQFVQDFLATLAPGQSLSIQASAAALTSFDLFASATWIEEPI